jgi:hypothetical protein
MHLDPNKRQLLYGVATAALVIAVAALWVPTSWQAGGPSGNWVGGQASVTHVEFGVLKPLQLTWESSPAGFWFGLTAVRAFLLFLSVTFTVTAVMAARQTYRRSRQLT